MQVASVDRKGVSPTTNICSIIERRALLMKYEVQVIPNNKGDIEGHFCQHIYCMNVKKKKIKKKRRQNQVKNLKYTKIAL